MSRSGKPILDFYRIPNDVYAYFRQIRCNFMIGLYTLFLFLLKMQREELDNLVKSMLFPNMFNQSPLSTSCILLYKISADSVP